MLKFHYMGIGGVIKEYDIVPVWFTIGRCVPSESIFLGYYSKDCVVFDGILAN